MGGAWCRVRFLGNYDPAVILKELPLLTTSWTRPNLNRFVSTFDPKKILNTWEQVVHVGGGDMIGAPLEMCAAKTAKKITSTSVSKVKYMNKKG